jgi:hypothetical protein
MWNPSATNISDKEIIGRRAFGDEAFIPSPQGQLVHYLVFYDSRFQTDLSVDRLGGSSVEDRVRRFLTPHAVHHGETRLPKQQFHGWAQIPVKKLKKIKIAPSPKGDKNKLDDLSDPYNPYHADIVRDGYRTQQTAEVLAYALAQMASQFHLVSPLSDKKKKMGILRMLCDAVEGIVGFLRRR